MAKMVVFTTYGENKYGVNIEEADEFGMITEVVEERYFKDYDAAYEYAKDLAREHELEIELN